MKRQNRSGSGARKLLAAALAVSMVLLATDAFGQGKRGALAIVTLQDDSVTAGELIAVRPASILLLDSSGKDLSLALTEVRMIRVSRHSKAGQGALAGLFLGGLTGFVGGSVYAKSQNLCPGCEAPLARGFFAILGAGAGVVGGLIAGSAAGKDLVLSFDGVSASSRAASLARLHKLARIEDAGRP